MLQRIPSILILALLSGATTAAAEGVAAPGPDIHFLNERGHIERGVRCATPTPGREEAARVERELSQQQALFGAARPPRGIQIPVAFHVIYSDTRKNGIQGYVESSQVQAQIDVLNDAFSATGYFFYLSELDYVQRNNWFTGCYGAERPMKKALTVDTANTLNIYSCRPNGNILGYAYLPWSYPEDHYLHGVVALYSSLPGGTAAPYNEGDTITHEVGHYLGLYYTFRGGCNEPGDFVADTPAEASPAYGCPTGRDSCPSDGPDPITNFMDYVDDFCMDEFTSDQGVRIDESVALYKPSLLD